MATRSQRGQSTVELACILPIVVICLLLAVQAGLVVRDRVLVVHAARAAGRQRPAKLNRSMVMAPTGHR